MAIALKTADSPASRKVTVSGIASLFVAQNSAPIATTPDGAEVWAVISDANRVAVIDTATDATVATLSVPAQPSSLAITPDGERILVASSVANTMVVIDGRYSKLEEVIDYLTVTLGLSLSAPDKQDLIAFLRTLYRSGASLAEPPEQALAWVRK